MGWMIMPYQRYFDFQGRSRRMEYWMFTVFTSIISLLLLLPIVIDFISIANSSSSAVDIDSDPFGSFGAFSWICVALWLIFLLGSFIPGLAVSVRRFHDVGMSGWVFVGLYVASILIGFVGLAIIVIAFLPSKEGTNKWGPNPKDPFDEEVFA